jgi:hypothetical protein
MRPTDRAAVVFVNNADEAAPAGCALEPDGTVTSSGQLGVVKPTAKSEGSTAILINGPVPVPAGGVGQAWSPYPFATVALDTADVPLSTTPAALGAVAGDWYLRKSGVGFLAIVPDAGGYTTAVPTAGESGFWAEITGSGGTPTAYSWKKKELDSSFAWVDSSPSVTGTENAYPVAGSSGPPPVQTGTPVWMRPSRTESDKYEFLAVSGGPGFGTIFKVLVDWQCVSSVPTLTFKYVWLPPGAQIYTDLASAESAHPGAAEA